MKKALLTLVFIVVAIFAATPPKAEAFRFNLFESFQANRITKVQIAGRIQQRSHQAIIEFSKLKDAKHIWYELSYQHDGVAQGVSGNFEVADGTGFIIKTILLGTCSAGGTCIYHSPRTANLRVVVEYKNGTNFAMNKVIR